MNQTSNLVRAIQGALKAKGITYRILAQKMRISEATVKRMFFMKSIDLGRLEKICDILDIDFFELAKLAKKSVESDDNSLSLDQERALASDLRLFGLFCLLIKGTSLAHVRKSFGFEENELNRYLLELENLKLIERHPGNKLRFPVNRHFVCRKGGPLKETYERDLKNDFLNSRFAGNLESLQLATVSLTRGELEILGRRIENLVREIKSLDAPAGSRLKDEKRLPITCMIAYRPWVFSAIRQLRSR